METCLSIEALPSDWQALKTANAIDLDQAMIEACRCRFSVHFEGAFSRLPTSQAAPNSLLTPHHECVDEIVQVEVGL